jgi:hypothetical protein
VEPEITVLYPNGGESFASGSTIKIEWTTQNVSEVAIEYNLTDSEDTWNMIDNSVPASQNGIDWIVPDAESDRCRIMVSKADELLISDRSDNTFTIFNYPENINITRNINFGDVTATSSYRMIGIPGENNLPVDQFIDGYTDNWRVYYDNGRVSDYLVEYKAGNSLFNFIPGRGFWFVGKSELSVNLEVKNVPLDEDLTYSIPLHSGWNIISNPFLSQVNWSDVRTVNNLDAGDVIHGFNGSFNIVSTFNPYTGYYFYNANSARTMLKIPYRGPGTLLKTDVQDVLYIILEGEESSAIGIGYTDKASETFDGYDIFKPRGDFEDASITIFNKNLELPYKYLHTEFRPELGEGQVYDVDIRLVPGTEVTLHAEGMQNVAGCEIMLQDLRLNKIYNLGNSEEITYSSLHRDNKFKLLIGDEHFIQDYTDKIVPSQFELFQNYPNPFNPRTIIRFALAEPGNVNLSVYNSLGELMYVIIADKYFNQGYHEVEFSASSVNGSEFASGVYFYKIQSGSLSDVKKFVLLK